uniref:Annexin n=1 Tax=Ascaris lumbricoides TaxID=6252 RepID=A0A9J2PTT7_ASCLU
MPGLGTKEKILIEILCSRNNEELAAIRNEYQNEYGKTLEQDVIGDTSGTLQRLLVSLLQGNRDESQHVDALKANQDAHKLLAGGEKKFGTDDSIFNSILVTQNFHQLERVFVEYEKITGHGIDKAIEKEFSGDTKRGFLAIVNCIESKPRYFAKQLYDAMKGLGTRDNDLIRVIISRSEIDLALIRAEFEVMYKKPLVDFIKSDCSGAYRDALISIGLGTRDNDLIRVIISRSEIDLALIRAEFEVMYKKPLVDFIKSDCSGAYRDALISIVKGN